MQRHFIYTVVSLFISFSSFSQPSQGKVESNYTYKHFTLTDGLPQIQCSTITSDYKGFIWVGTKFGAARWDGRQFNVFNRKNGTLSDMVNTFTELSDGSMLVGFSGTSFSIISGNYVQSWWLPLPNNVFNIQQTYPFKKNQALLFVTPKTYDTIGNYANIFIFDKKTRTYTRHFRLKANTIDFLNENGDILSYSYIHPDEPEKVVVRYYNWDKLIETRKYFCRILSRRRSNVANRTIVEFPSKPGKFYNFTITGCHIDTTLLVNFNSADMTSHPVYWGFATDENKFAYYLSKDSKLKKLNDGTAETIGQIQYVNDIYDDKSGNLWVCTEQGLYCYFRQTFKEIKFKVNPGKYDDIWSVTRNKSGTYYYSSRRNKAWQSTDNNITWQQIDWLYENPYQNKSVSGSFGAGSTQLGGTILPTGGDFYYLRPPNIRKFFHLSSASQLFGSLEDSIKHDIFIHQQYALYRLNEITLKLDSLILPNNRISNSIIQLCFDKENRIVVCGRGGPLRMEDGKWKKLKNCNLDVYSVTRDFTGNLWVSDWLNLYLYNYNSLIKLRNLPSKEMTIALTTYKNRWLVIGGSADLTFMDLDAFYKTGKEIYYRYDAGSGLNVLEGGQNNFFHDHDGTILWPCSDKLIRIYPERLLQTEAPNTPEILLGKAIDRNGQFIVLADTSQNTSFKLPKGYRNLDFTFASAVFNNNEILRYRYRLKGYSEQWSEPTNLNVATFTNIPPGVYSFEVQCSMNGLDWSETAVSYEISIPNYFYETTFHRILMIITTLVAVGLLSVLISQRMRQLKYLKLKQQQQINDLKLKAIRTKAIPHFSGNVYNNIDYLIENQQYDDASRYLALLSRIHNKVLLDADKPSHSLKEELEFVETYIKLEKLRFKDNLKFSIEIKPKVNMAIQIPIMIIHTYVENAIKHGLMSKKGKGSVAVEIENDDNGIWIRVKDDGIGRNEALHYNLNSTGIGLKIFEKQIELYNISNINHILQKVDDLVDADGSPIGTQFSLYVPMDFTYET